MSKFLINGGKELKGCVNISGSKNAALPIIFATLIARGISIISNVPDISDVRVALEIVESFGANVLRDGKTLYIDTRCLEYCVPDEKLISKIRASSYLLGASLARFGRCRIANFGGCNFAFRPIDMHISAMQAAGARIEGDEAFADRLSGCDIVFEKKSVGATVNAILIAAAAEGESRIFGYAKEPHIFSLIEFLNTAGAEITVRPEYIKVSSPINSGGRARIIPDMIEAGTYLILSVASESRIEIKGVESSHLYPLYKLLCDGGVSLSFSGDSVFAEGRMDRFVSAVATPYPGFPTDMQPLLAPLFALNCGGEIRDEVWPSRFGYLGELLKFGARYSISDRGAKIFPSVLTPAGVSAPDLRGGAALVIAALTADGESVIENAEIIGRGYESIVEKLRSVGADIKELN